VLLYLLEEEGMELKAIERLLYRESGLLGVSEISSDMRTLLASSDPRAEEAIALFCHRAIREVGSLWRRLADSMPWSLPVGPARTPPRSASVSPQGWYGWG
jgi:acetate kinase